MKEEREEEGRGEHRGRKGEEGRGEERRKEKKTLLGLETSPQNQSYFSTLKEDLRQGEDLVEEIVNVSVFGGHYKPSFYKITLDFRVYIVQNILKPGC